MGAIGVAGLLRHQLGRHAEPRPGAWIGDDLPADIVLPVLAVSASTLRSCGLSTPVCLPPRAFWNSLMAATIRSLTSPVMAPLYWPTQARSDWIA